MAYTFKHGDRPLEGLTVQRAVGRGGFGEVYYALTDSGKQVALKFLRENPEIELRGIGHVMNLKSPHLITIYDVRRNAASDPFVIMEYIGGPSLRELMLAAPGGLGVQKAAFFLSGIAKGLSYLHERGIVHRDLKPANIFYDDGYVKIGDYGLSKHISVSRHSGQTVSVGTVHYMAPEIGSGNYTKAIDIYALGVILYEMLTGRLPFSGASTAEILMRHLRDNPDLAGIPAPFTGVIAKALAKEPAERYQNVDEMLAAVMESADIGRSLDSFDHSALTQVPRSAEASDADETVTSPHRPPPVPVLDAREVAQPDPAAARQALPPRLQHKLDHLTRKMEKKAAKLERKLGRRAGAAPAAPPVHRVAQLFILLAVTLAIALGLGLWTMHQGLPESRVLAVALFLIGGTVGPLLAHLWLLQRSPTRNTLVDRLAYASLAGLFMMPAHGLASGEISDDLARTILAPMAAMVICGWNRRIEEGRRGKVDGWAAFFPAIVGLVVAHIADAGAFAWTAAGMCAGIALLTQAAASMWPVVRTAGAAPAPAPSPGGSMGNAVPGSAQAAPPASSDVPVGSGGPVPASAVPSETAAPPVVVHAEHPSFVGRTANAGLSLLGKLLLLIGLLVALAHGVVLDKARTAMHRGDLRVDREVAGVIAEGVPAGAVFVPLVLGSLFLVIARRRDGGAHFLRGCAGCLLAMWGALGALVWADGALKTVLTSTDWSRLAWGDLAGPLALSLVPLALGVFLLLWPKAQANRPLVI